MKRMTLGTIAMLGALAVVTVKLPSVIVGQPMAVFESHGTLAEREPKDVPTAFLPRLQAVSPLVIEEGTPSPPALIPFSVSGLADNVASRHDDTQGRAQGPAEERSRDYARDLAAALGAAGLGVSLGVEGTAPGWLANGQAGEDGGGLALSAGGASVRASAQWAALRPMRPNELAAEHAGLGLGGFGDADGAVVPGLAPAEGPARALMPAGTATGSVGELTRGQQTRGEAQSDGGGPAKAAARVSVPGSGQLGANAWAGVNQGAGPDEPADPSDAQMRGEARQGFVVLEEAARRHPLWAELASVEQEMDACSAQWRREVDASCLTESDIRECYAAAERLILASAASREAGNTRDGLKSGTGSDGVPHPAVLLNGLEEAEERLREETERTIEAYSAEVSARLEDDLYAERARLNEELDDFRDKTLKEHYLGILNAQLKLRLLKMSEDESKDLRERIARLTVDMETKVESKAAENDAVFQAYAKERCDAAEADVAAFRARAEQDLAARIAAERARLEKTVTELLNETDPSSREEIPERSEEIVRRARIELDAAQERISRELAAKEADFAARYAALQARRDALYETIHSDIRTAASELGAKQGMRVSVWEQAEPRPASASHASDVTEEVLRIIRNR